MQVISAIDYGIGNILSVIRAFEFCGTKVLVVNSKKGIENSEVLVLPGVGAFSKGMKELVERDYILPIKKFCKSGKPFLGICLGMQMMFESSEEFGFHKGLSLVKGQVKSIPSTDGNDKPHKIPHIGWNELISTGSMADWKDTILENVQKQNAVYFVHSFAADITSSENCLATCDYNGRKLAAVIESENLYGCQFHPEKSGASGLQIIKNFISISKKTS